MTLIVVDVEADPVNDAKGNAEVLLRLHEIGMRGVIR